MNFREIIEHIESLGHEVSIYMPLCRRVFVFGHISICDAEDTTPVICKIDKDNERYPLSGDYKTVLIPERGELLNFFSQWSSYQSDLSSMITTKRKEESAILLVDGVPTYWPEYGRNIDNLETFDMEIDTHQDLVDEVHKVVPAHHFVRY